VSTRKSRATEQSLNALEVVSQIMGEELGESDPRYHLIRAIPKAWNKLDTPRWEAASNMLGYDTYEANEPLLRPAALGLLVEISDALCDFFAGHPVDPRAGTIRACELQAMVDHLGRIVEATTRDYAP
jgi:hypothetical protein